MIPKPHVTRRMNKNGEEDKWREENTIIEEDEHQYYDMS